MTYRKSVTENRLEESSQESVKKIRKSGTENRLERSSQENLKKIRSPETARQAGRGAGPPGRPGRHHRGLRVTHYGDLRLPLAHHLHERGHNRRIELHPAPSLQIPQRAFLGPGLAVGSVGAERVVHVAHVHQL